MVIEWLLGFQNFNQQDGRVAGVCFAGPAFKGLAAAELTKEELLKLNDHLMIMSGLYGALKPLDVVKPYRLDVANNLKIKESSFLILPIH